MIVKMMPRNGPPLPNYQLPGTRTFRPNGSNGCLTGPNGLPNGSNFYKCLIRRKVYGLTGKTPPWKTLPFPLVLLLVLGTQSTQSSQVQPSPAKSNQPP